jgi:hypothetical protein
MVTPAEAHGDLAQQEHPVEHGIAQHAVGIPSARGPRLRQTARRSLAQGIMSLLVDQLLL